MGRWNCTKCNQKNSKKKIQCKHCNTPCESWEEESSLVMGNNYSENNYSDNALVEQGYDQVSKMEQESDEIIWIKDSCNVNVRSTDTQGAVSLQVGLQLAIALVISISLGDSDQGRAVAQEIFQSFDDEQSNKQKIYVENSKDVDIHTTDTDLSVNIQALLDVLLTLVVRIDVL